MNLHRARRRAARRGMVLATLAVMFAPIVHVDAAGAVSATTRKVAAAKKVKSPLPVMNVTDVKTGKQVALAPLFDGTKPMLVWFYAPH